LPPLTSTSAEDAKQAEMESASAINVRNIL